MCSLTSTKKAEVALLERHSITLRSTWKLQSQPTMSSRQGRVAMGKINSTSGLWPNHRSTKSLINSFRYRSKKNSNLLFVWICNSRHWNSPQCARVILLRENPPGHSVPEQGDHSAGTRCFSKKLLHLHKSPLSTVSNLSHRDHHCCFDTE